LINLKETENQDWISTFDLRFVNSGKEEIESTTLHSLEHLLIKHFRRVLGNNYVLLAPMGCRTGFYLCIYGKIDRSHMILKYKETLEGILNEQFVPYQTQVQCGNYLDHDLDKAKFVVSKVIKNFGSIGIVM
jgi:S-ribosylhomocysteine lyase